jgi:hypothetical protein
MPGLAVPAVCCSIICMYKSMMLQPQQTSSTCALRRAVALQDAAKGVQHLHSKSIVHGDLVSTTGWLHAGPVVNVVSGLDVTCP